MAGQNHYPCFCWQVPIACLGSPHQPDLQPQQFGLVVQATASKCLTHLEKILTSEKGSGAMSRH